MNDLISSLVAGQTPSTMGERMKLQVWVIRQVAVKTNNHDMVAVTEAVAPIFAQIVPSVRVSSK